TIVHFEIPSDNLERTRKFYTELFGWKMEKMPGTGQQEYWMFSTTSNDKDSSNSGSGEQQRTVSGGTMQRQMPQEPIMIYIGVDSVTEYSNKVERLGGKVIKQKTEVPNYGWFAICTDTENNGFALWEANTNTK
ncbi:MAG: VOC family protein, partial [Thermoproteota archaeon]|nr:VOC family protein [Thermoproteota archaeon]